MGLQTLPNQLTLILSHFSSHLFGDPPKRIPQKGAKPRCAPPPKNPWDRDSAQPDLLRVGQQEFHALAVLNPNINGLVFGFESSETIDIFPCFSKGGCPVKMTFCGKPSPIVKALVKKTDLFPLTVLECQLISAQFGTQYMTVYHFIEWDIPSNKQSNITQVRLQSSNLDTPCFICSIPMANLRYPKRKMYVG